MMDPRVARNLLQIMASQIEQANALLEAAHMLREIAFPSSTDTSKETADGRKA